MIHLIMKQALKSVTPNTWVLSIIATLVSGSFAMNVYAVREWRAADQLEYRTADAMLHARMDKTQAAFADSVKVIDALRREMEHRITRLETIEEVRSGEGQ